MIKYVCFSPARFFLNFSFQDVCEAQQQISCSRQSVWSLKCHFTQICLPVMSSVTAAERWTEWTAGAQTINTPQKLSAYQPRRPDFPQFQTSNWATNARQRLFLILRCRSFKVGQMWHWRQRILKSQCVAIFFTTKGNFSSQASDKCSAVFLW